MNSKLAGITIGPHGDQVVPEEGRCRVKDRPAKKLERRFGRISTAPPMGAKLGRALITHLVGVEISDPLHQIGAGQGSCYVVLGLGVAA
jgi:hypothetical protein